MKLVMTLLVHNELDIVETNLAYHRAQGVDFFILMDRKSTDGTREILRRWEEEGLARLLLRDVECFDQGPWVSEMARLAHDEYGADWVINNDTDEFWWPAEGTLRTVLEAVPEDVGVLVVPRHNFAPRPPGEGLFWERMTLRETRSVNAAGVPLQGKALHRGSPDAEVHHGNHGVMGGVPGRTVLTDSICVLHFPMRSYEQFEYKIASGGRVLERTDLPERVGHTWRRLYALYREGRLKEHYAEKLLPDEAVEEALSGGTHVVDRRLSVFLRARGIGAPGAA